MSVIPAEFGPVIDRSEDAAREFILYKHEPVERVLYNIGQSVGGVIRYMD